MAKNKCSAWDNGEWDSKVRESNAKFAKETKEEIKARSSVTWLTIQKHITDRLAPIKSVLREHLGADRAERTIRRMEVATGGSAMGMVEAQRYLRSVYGDMSESEEANFNEVILAMRIIAIDKHRVAAARREIKQLTGDESGSFKVYDTKNEKHLKELRKALKKKDYTPKTVGTFVILKFEKDKASPKKRNKVPYEFTDYDKALTESSEEVERILVESEILHPDHLGSKEQKEFLKEMEKKDPDAYLRMTQKATEYFGVYKKQLEILFLEGMITSEDYIHFKTVGHYSPRQYLKFFDPEITNDSLMALTTGSTSSINMDSANLLREYIIRLHTRIARNKANVELYHAAKNGEAPGLIKIVDESVEEKVGDNFKLISAYIGGKKYRLKMPLEFGRNWLESESGMSRDAAHAFRKFTGADLVRAYATGYNPEFAITNLPRDLMFSWFRTREYSNWIPLAVPQMAARMWEIRKDVWHTSEDPRGVAKEYLDEYGMMDFMTQQGEFGGRAWQHTGGKSSWQEFKNAASFFGAKTELWVRLALRQQAIKNRAAKNNGVVTKEMREQATWIARGYLDFSKGGSSVKTLDHFVPYLNASVIATTGLAETLFGKGGTGYRSQSKHVVNEGNVVAWFKFAQFFTIVTSSIMANLLLWSEEYDRMDDSDKEKNLIIPLPFLKDKDKNGATITGMFKLPLDQGQTMISSLAGSLLANTLKSMGYGNGKTVLDKYANIRSEIFKEGVMVGVPNLSMPPIIKASLGYFSNIDTFGWKPVVPGEPKENLGMEFAGKTPFDHPFLSMTADQLNEILPQFGGMIPEEPFSPARIAFVFNTVFVPSNTFVKIVKGFFGEWTGLEKKLFGTGEMDEIDKTISRDVREATKIIPGVDRFFEWTKGENQEDIKQADKISIKNNERESRFEAKLFGYLTRLNQTPPPKGQRSGLTSTANELVRKAILYVNEQKLTPDNRKRAINRIIDYKSYKASVGQLDNPHFWYKVGREGDPLTRAKMIFYKWEKTPEYRPQLMREFRKLRRVSNKKTKMYLNALIANYRGEREINPRNKGWLAR